MKVDLYLFRHGRTTWNALGRYQGRAESDLDPLGILQADAVAARCALLEPTALYSSDLRRCRDVAKKVSATTQLHAVEDERLRERDFGSWSGRTREEIANEYPDEFAAWRAGDPNVRPGGGEACGQVIERVSAFMDDVVARHANANAGAESDAKVVVITHGGWIVSVAQWLFHDIAVRAHIGAPSQASLSRVHWNGTHWQLLSYNDVGHLLHVDDPAIADVL